MKSVDQSERTLLHTYRTALFLTFLIFGLLASGCSIPGAASTGSEDTVDARPAPDLITPETAETDSLESSIVLLRTPGEPHEVAASAVIVSDDGYLVTSLSAVDNPVEVVLQDGTTARPALVTTDSTVGLALLKVPVEDLSAVEFGAGRPSSGSEMFATGYDSASGTLGHMSGKIVAFEDDIGEFEFRIRGSVLIDTDINLLDGFSGGALSDGDGVFNGVLIPGETDDGDQVFRAVSHWFLQAWLEHRQDRLDRLAAQIEDWDSIDLPSGWSLRQPDGWHLNVTADNGDGYRAELLPADPDVPLQITVSVEENEYGTDASAFVSEMFESRSSAQVWEISRKRGVSFAQIAMTQEGALVDVAYYLDEEPLIAISMTSSYHLPDDQVQVDEARALFTTVVESLHRP